RQPAVKHARRASWLLLLHLESDLRGLPGFDIHVLRLLAERLVPHLDGVLAGRDVVDLGHAIGIGNAEEWARHDGDPPEHPAVYIAGELDHLRLLELLPPHLLELA